MKIEAAGEHLKRRLLQVDDSTLPRLVLHALIAAAVAFLVIDFRDLSIANAKLPVFDPAPDSMPVLPPALTDGEPDNAPSEITTSVDLLKQPMTFELQPRGVLLARGAIEYGAAGRFQKEIEARGEYVKTVSLDSPGGAVGDALAMSKLIRERKIGTTVAKGALCASSCPIILSGGVSRSADDGVVIGVHQVFNGTKEKLSPERAMSDAQRTTADVTRHLDAMGIKPGLWIHAMETPPDRLYYLKPAEMKEFALVTTPEKVSAAAAKVK
ncbi:hypothetical protein AB4Z25_10775 [Rhizobium sp. RAF36]|jgi:hypothetical protein|uniref:hypothetical protein n=1 Tax=Rhizobium sp. RAF36 TaxID=3233055 RepID=UPI000DD5577F